MYNMNDDDVTNQVDYEGADRLIWKPDVYVVNQRENADKKKLTFVYNTVRHGTLHAKTRIRLASLRHLWAHGSCGGCHRAIELLLLALHSSIARLSCFLAFLLVFSPHPWCFIVGAQGVVRHVHQRVVTFSCPMDFGKYPFDNHECSLKYSTFSQSAQEV